MLDLHALHSDGLVEIDKVESQEHLIEIAKAIGRVVPNSNGEAIVKLIATDGRSALKGTFSDTFGFGQFPLHTDTAYFSLPVRYLILGMADISESSTRYVQLHELLYKDSARLLSLARKSVCVLETFEGAKYVPVIFSSNGVEGFRFDPNIMRPANKAAREFLRLFLEAVASLEVKEIDWTGHKAVVFDNWKCLHGRSRVVSSKREILRIYVE